MTAAEFRARATELLRELAARDEAQAVIRVYGWGRRQAEIERHADEVERIARAAQGST